MNHVRSSIGRIRQNAALNTAVGVWRWLMWQVRSRLPIFPYRIALSEKSHLLVNRRIEANGCAAQAFIHGLYDYDNMSLIVDLFRGGSEFNSFLDVGGNIGVYALLASENESARVVSFEPHPATVRILQQNLDANERKNVEVINAALSVERCELILSGAAGDPKNQLVASNDVEEGNRVNCYRADEWCREQNFMPDIVKIDVEGHELEVLRGMSDLMKGVKLILLEENIAPEIIAEILPREQFLGPVYVDFEKKEIGKPTPLIQDACYILRDALPDLEKRGYGVSSSV